MVERASHLLMALLLIVTLHHTTPHNTIPQNATQCNKLLNTPPRNSHTDTHTHLCGLSDLSAWRHTELPALRLKKSARMSDIIFVSSTIGKVTATNASSKKLIISDDKMKIVRWSYEREMKITYKLSYNII